MSNSVISIDRLGKAYRIGLAHPKHTNFREVLVELARTPLRRWRMKSEDWSSEADTHWAIRDISFEVGRGEVIGVIGRNGAGKSTLLKCLSRITEPTEGQARLRGRSAALLEVGTGFHPELTGRENIFLNGAILGMRRAEIRAKFDQIVAFSEIDKFLDTPVKRYSSGMYVRLAFSVAAHLDPEVLIIDEVLAVGDAAFQAKCLGKMQQVATGEGRTVLFVSHNMDAVASLCDQVVLIEGGRASERLEPEDAVKRYFALSGRDDDAPLASKPRKQHRPRPPIFTRLTITSASGQAGVVQCGEGVTFEVQAEGFEDLRELTCGVALHNDRGQRVLLLHSQYHSQIMFDGMRQARFVCHVPALPLVPSRYFVELVMADQRQFIEKVERADWIDVIHSDYLGTGHMLKKGQGYLVLPCEWSCKPA
jgi:lipopolysaccharide transport system ATP-binding protein